VKKLILLGAVGFAVWWLFFRARDGGGRDVITPSRSNDWQV